jgi:hypothetical protein
MKNTQDEIVDYLFGTAALIIAGVSILYAMASFL